MRTLILEYVILDWYEHLEDIKTDEEVCQLVEAALAAGYNIDIDDSYVTVTEKEIVE